jgi:LysR family glycine cleavage system transcriptional activator
MSKWMPSLNSLRAFETVARHSSYQKAAEELGVTPAAVKQLVAKLEDTLGCRLIERNGRGVALTSIGELGVADISAGMRLLADATTKMRAPNDGVRLIISVESSFATTWLVPRLEDFRSRYPQINVLIDSSQRIVDLERSEVDIAVRYGVKHDPDMIAHRLFDDRVFPACSPALLGGRAVADIGELSKMPLIHWDMSQLPWAEATRRWFDWGSWVQLTNVEGIDVSKGARFNDYGLAVQAAISGQGVLLASGPILQDAMEAGLLVQPFQGYVGVTDIGYDLVTTHGAANRPEVSAFIDWLLQTARSSSGER